MRLTDAGSDVTLRDQPNSFISGSIRIENTLRVLEENNSTKSVVTATVHTLWRFPCGRERVGYDHDWWALSDLHEAIR